ncbi:hypothetical protein [Roseibacillus ishigakijimensis]|uniref:Uncharacterized protein n=1 Tax=Roseibacillus ishigakijimensis TaxID=454146 RepID=A0A934VL07_9BACT|nr:hypothetical protein [Roseibacillus ishigakijimensis]MBK1832727.1 hypothetical protein [Roseibacillus ishigakijimensis]
MTYRRFDWILFCLSLLLAGLLHIQRQRAKWLRELDAGEPLSLLWFLVPASLFLLVVTRVIKRWR